MEWLKPTSKFMLNQQRVAHKVKMMKKDQMLNQENMMELVQRKNNLVKKMKGKKLRKQNPRN
jgi:hypothetical protein